MGCMMRDACTRQWSADRREVWALGERESEFIEKAEQDLEVRLNARVPAGDGGIALGQAAFALALGLGLRGG